MSGLYRYMQDELIKSLFRNDLLVSVRVLALKKLSGGDRTMQQFRLVNEPHR